MAMDMFNLRRCSAGEKVELNSTQRRYLLIQFYVNVIFLYCKLSSKDILSTYILSLSYSFHCLVAILKRCLLVETQSRM